MLTTILLISTICYSNECHEFVMDSFKSHIPQDALNDCLLQGIELEMDNPGLAWHCSEPSDFIPIYTPRSIPE